MGTIPEVIGGPGGIGAEDYVRKYEQALYAACGIGLYNPDYDSGHGRYRRGAATIFARILSRMGTLFYEAIPTRSYYTLPLWEQVFGLGPVPSSDWTIEQRRARLQSRLWTRRGNHPCVIKLAFERLTGQTVKVHSARVDVPHGVPSLPDGGCRFDMTVIVPQSVYEDPWMWAECKRLARHIEPAHGLLSVAVSYDTTYTDQPEFRCGVSLCGRDTLGRDDYT